MHFVRLENASNRLKKGERSRTSRWLQLFLGLLLYGVAIALMVRSNLGLGPWDAFHVGLSRLTGMSIGVASIVVGLAILVGTYFINVRPGTGTLANMVFIGVFIDLIMPVIPNPGGWLLAFLYFSAGIVLCGLATGLYIGAGLGKGPRDGLMIGISQLTNWPVGRVRTIIEMSVLALGWLMGGTVGIGTILFTFSIGPATQWGLQLFGMTATGSVRPLHVPEPHDSDLRRAA